MQVHTLLWLCVLLLCTWPPLGGVHSVSLVPWQEEQPHVRHHDHHPPYRILNQPSRKEREPQFIPTPPPRTTSANDRLRPRDLLTGCPTRCRLRVHNFGDIKATFQDLLDDPDISLVSFKLHFPGQNVTMMEDHPYMGNNFHATEWIWASQRMGRKLLGLPIDADVLSLFILDDQRRRIDLHITTEPPGCLIMQSPRCRIHSINRFLIYNLTHADRHQHRRDFICHRVISNATMYYRGEFWSDLLYHCCDTSEFKSGDVSCRAFSTLQNDISSVINVLYIIAAIFTAFSPIVILKIKMLLKFDNVTKFFRASLKHGITGQRNYVIRISSRQLINLSDPKPFSIPRFLFRLLFHCYGEGRCCIHWWGEWRHQPDVCNKDSSCRHCYLYFWRFFAVVIIYPVIIYLGIALYAPRILLYHSMMKFVEDLEGFQKLYLNINPLGWSLLPGHNPIWAVWMLFSFVAFIYTVLLLSWPNNPLERCLLHTDTRRPFERPHLLYDRMTQGYKRILQKLAYGDFPTKTHFFRIRWLPWGIRRLFHLTRRLIMQIPVINICFSLNMIDHKFFAMKEKEERDEDEMTDAMECSFPSCRTVCKAFCACIVWTGFSFILAGYCTAVFVMAEFLLSVVFFTTLGAVLNASSILPWLCCTAVILYYTNDTLAIINREHREILKLIDENSPRISAVEDAEEVFRDGAIQILKTHNLGAVKFIDGDNTEYVAKELYYNVCADLQCGWSRSLRRIFVRMTVVSLFVTLVFLSFTALGAFYGSGLVVTVLAVIASLTPKGIEVWRARRPGRIDKSQLWAKIMPDILDRHIRVDRTRCLDETEEDLTTYDVRPIGLLEMDIPRMQVQRSLRLWKFPWVVSADQQTQTHESFIVALANKLAAASLLSKLVTKAFSPDLEDETVLRQWCLLVENCILEGSATASSINGVPMESVRLFPRDVQPLVSTFHTGNTIDAVVDNINRELYGPFTKGVLVTISNTTLALCKMDNTIFAFNSSCHGDQVTDLFGAVLIATEFNTQNLQTTIKFIVDPYAPDAVPVYSIVPIEGFVFRSPSVLQLDVPVEI